MTRFFTFFQDMALASLAFLGSVPSGVILPWIPDTRSPELSRLSPASCMHGLWGRNETTLALTLLLVACMNAVI